MWCKLIKRRAFIGSASFLVLWPSSRIQTTSEIKAKDKLLQAQAATPAPKFYVITEPCIGTKGTKCDIQCAEVCPQNCIHPREDEDGFKSTKMVYINPDECISCGACEPACPVEAIFPEDELPSKWKEYKEVNASYYKRKSDVKPETPGITL